MEVVLREWERASAGPDSRFPVLNGLFLEDPRIRLTLQSHPLGNKLRVSECRYGLVLEARQHVGVLQLGPVRVRIRPKMHTVSLWSALTYALGLDEIVRHMPIDVDVVGDFADLLALLLLTESHRLWRSGIQRGYRETSEWSSTVRGRLDVVAFARRGPMIEATLPCRQYSFTTDVIENRIVLAGLTLASDLTSDLKIRSALHRAAQQWSTICAPVVLSKHLLDSADRSRNRLTARYSKMHALIRLVYEGFGLDDEHAVGGHTLPGFLWNMASLFERFIARFILDYLPDHHVAIQKSLHQLYRVVKPGPRLKPVRQRPDMVVRRNSDRMVIGIFDTKYRDLWTAGLPRDMLYQMSVYSLAWADSRNVDAPVVVLYPATGVVHPDMELQLQVADGHHRRIVLRAVDWGAAATLSTRSERSAWARRCIHGDR